MLRFEYIYNKGITCKTNSQDLELIYLNISRWWNPITKCSYIGLYCLVFLVSFQKIYQRNIFLWRSSVNIAMEIIFWETCHPIIGLSGKDKTSLIFRGCTSFTLFLVSYIILYLNTEAGVVSNIDSGWLIFIVCAFNALSQGLSWCNVFPNYGIIACRCL